MPDALAITTVPISRLGLAQYAGLHILMLSYSAGLKILCCSHKMRTTATPTYLSKLVQTHWPMRCSAAWRSSHTHRTYPSRFICCCSIHLEHSTCWHSTVQELPHFQMPV